LSEILDIRILTQINKNWHYYREPHDVNFIDTYM